MLALLVVLYACKEDKEIEQYPNQIINHVLPIGEITESLTLEANQTYYLKGKLIMNEGTSLTIEQGVKLIASDSIADCFIAIDKKAKLHVKGTKDRPVIMSSVEGRAGDWMGIIILGEGITQYNEVDDYFIEYQGFEYGGENDLDNSGSINYLVIRGAGGGQIFPSVASLLLYGVGSETSIKNVAVLNGSGDGISINGSMVDLSRIYIENCEDDAITWAEGWNGEIEHAYIKIDSSNFSAALEGQSISLPTIRNLCAVSNIGGTALQFAKEGSAFFDNIYLRGYNTQLEMKDDDSTYNVFLQGSEVDVSLLPGEIRKYKFNSGLRNNVTVDTTSWDWRFNNM
jgi:hypothetical protein